MYFTATTTHCMYSDPPTVSVHLANEDPSRNITRAEGQNVTLKCRADARPPVTSFGWYKNVSISPRLLYPFLFSHSFFEFDAIIIYTIVEAWGMRKGILLHFISNDLAMTHFWSFVGDGIDCNNFNRDQFLLSRATRGTIKLKICFDFLPILTFWIMCIVNLMLKLWKCIYK